MYKNFNITESEKEQILNRLKENGYKQPTNKKVITEERNLSLDDIQNHFQVIRKSGSNVVLRNKENRKYGIFNIKKRYWVDGYEPSFDQSDISLYTTESKDYFLLEKYVNENGNTFYILLDTDMYKNMDSDDFQVVKIFGQSGFDEAMEGLTLVSDSEEGQDSKYTDSVDEKDETMDKGDYMAKHGQNPLNEQISRIKNMMGKIMNESFDDFDTQIQPEERPEFDNMSVNDLNEDMVPDGRETLRSLKDKVKNGAKVFVDGKEVYKMPMLNLVTFVGGGKIQLPMDGEELDDVKDLIIVDGAPLEMLYKEKPKPIDNTDRRTPEEKAQAQRDWNDRYGPGGGYQTGAGFYTGD
jgi:hypothetical protein